MSVISLDNVGKQYFIYSHPIDRLWEAISGKNKHSKFVALHPTYLDIEPGEVIGLIGMNGAGKSTLLKIIAGTITPTEGVIKVSGRVSALLELGSGFHPDMSGRENVRLSLAVMGLNPSDSEELYNDIVEFSGIKEFMDQPVKTYSSGMFVRLAFAVATSVDPDILIVDEALSVGDGAFSRKSFDRIMGFKKSGKTILFCSHSLYQVEAICSRVIWIHHGRMMMDGDPAQVIAAYNSFLGQQNSANELPSLKEVSRDDSVALESAPRGHARLQHVKVTLNGLSGLKLEGWCDESDLEILVEFSSDPDLPAPSIGIAIVGSDGRFVCSAGTHNDGLTLKREKNGGGMIDLTYQKLPLLKGHYWINVFLLCENAMHIYDQADAVAELIMKQHDLQQGIVSLPHKWGLQSDPCNFDEHQ